MKQKKDNKYKEASIWWKYKENNLHVYLFYNNDCSMFCIPNIDNTEKSIENALKSFGIIPWTQEEQRQLNLLKEAPPPK